MYTLWNIQYFSFSLFLSLNSITSIQSYRLTNNCHKQISRPYKGHTNYICRVHSRKTAASWFIFLTPNFLNCCRKSYFVELQMVISKVNGLKWQHFLIISIFVRARANKICTNELCVSCHRQNQTLLLRRHIYEKRVSKWCVEAGETLTEIPRKKTHTHIPSEETKSISKKLNSSTKTHLLLLQARLFHSYAKFGQIDINHSCHAAKIWATFKEFSLCTEAPLQFSFCLLHLGRLCYIFFIFSLCARRCAWRALLNISKILHFFPGRLR